MLEAIMRCTSILALALDELLGCEMNDVEIGCLPRGNMKPTIRLVILINKKAAPMNDFSVVSVELIVPFISCLCIPLLSVNKTRAAHS